MIEYVRTTNGAAFFRNLGQQIIDNPVPVALVGTGLAWLMIQNGRTLGRSDTTDEMTVAGRRFADETARQARDLSDRTKSATAAASEKVRAATSRASDAVTDVK